MLSDCAPASTWISLRPMLRAGSAFALTCVTVSIARPARRMPSGTPAVVAMRIRTSVSYAPVTWLRRAIVTGTVPVAEPAVPTSVHVRP